jgi:hypothetical protein
MRVLSLVLTLTALAAAAQAATYSMCSSAGHGCCTTGASQAACLTPDGYVLLQLASEPWCQSNLALTATPKESGRVTACLHPSNDTCGILYISTRPSSNAASEARVLVTASGAGEYLITEQSGAALCKTQSQACTYNATTGPIAITIAPTDAACPSLAPSILWVPMGRPSAPSVATCLNAGSSGLYQYFYVNALINYADTIIVCPI